METSGFYKNENGFLIHAPNAVLNASYELFKEQKDSYSLPIDGWHWFDDEDSAYSFFNLLKPESENVILNSI